jgi:hypothetical protein
MTTAFRPSLRIGKKCKASGKRKFRTSLDVLLDHADNPRRIRPYECPDCGFWHGSSKP